MSETEFRRKAYRRGWARNFRMAIGAAVLMFTFFKVLGALIDYLRM